MCSYSCELYREGREVITSERFCKFCGNKIVDKTEYVLSRNDFGGNDKVDTYEEKGVCTCQIGKMVEKFDAPKKMCINCLSYRTGKCLNKDTINEVSTSIENFDLGTVIKELPIKNPTKKCKHHSYDMNIFSALFK